MPQKLRTGTVLHINHPTARVRVDRMAKHPLYEKAYRVSRSFLVHVPEGLTPAVGDQVEIAETRPVSKRKRWLLAKIVRDEA